MIYDHQLRSLISLAYFDGRMKLIKNIYRYFKDGSFKMVWTRVQGDYVLITPDALRWLNSEVGKEYQMKIQTNKKWELIEFEELL